MTTKSFIKTIGEKGLLADYNTEGKKLQTELIASDNITIDGNTISSDQVFVATYGTTTYQEIKNAYAAGKICTIFKDGKRHYHITEITNEYIKFGSVSQSPTIYTLTVSRNNKWSSYDPWLQTHLTFDSEPTAGSKNPVTSDGIKTAISNSVDQTYSSTSTKAQSGVAVNEAFKTRETSESDNSYTYLGMSKSGEETEKLYWKLVSFKPVINYWTLQFEIDVSNGRKSTGSFDTNIYETKRLTIYSGDKNTVENAIELRYTPQTSSDSRGYGNNIYYEMDSSGTVTVYIYAKKSANTAQICRLTSVRNLKGINNITWHTPVADAGTQPTNPIKFKEDFPAIASKTSDIGSDSVPVYVNKGKPVSCNSSNLKAGKDDDGNVIKNTYATKTELNAKQNNLTAGDNITISADNVISADKQILFATYGVTTYDEVRNAMLNGVDVFVKDDSHILHSMWLGSNIYFESVVANPTTIRQALLKKDNSWSIVETPLQMKLRFDTAPTAGSNNPVTSDGIKTALDSRIPAPTSTTGTQVLKCINGVVQWVTE